MVYYFRGAIRCNFKYAGKIWCDVISPVLLNIAMIATALFLAPHVSSPDLALAIGIFLGGLLQFLFQIPFLKQAGLLVKPKWAWNDAV